MKTTIIETGRFYHIYNRVKNGGSLFNEEEDFRFFLKLYRKHIVPVADTWAYCMLPDHVHFLVKMKEAIPKNSFSPFALLFNSYAKGFGKRNGTDGKVFRFKLKRVEIRRDSVLLDMIRYINQNPYRHGAISDCSRYQYSSFRATVCNQPTLVAREEIQKHFGNAGVILSLLGETVNEPGLKKYLLED